MFAAYFDDSETSHVAALAGYVAPATVWDAFETEWEGFLVRREIPFYHATDCAAGWGHYRDWSPGDRMSAHREAVEIIVRYPLVPLGISVAGPAFEAMYAGLTPEGGRGHPKPFYHYCFTVILAELAHFMADHHPEEQIAIVLEQTPKVVGIVGHAYEYYLTERLKEFSRHFSGTPVFHPKRGFPQLQAADVLAYELTLDAGRHFNPPRPYPQRGSWIALSLHCDQQGGHIMYLPFP